MKTAGLVLDFYDDKTGGILKAACPTPDSLPGAVKTAHVLSSEERDVLRDDAFALILHDNGKVLRKFACVDEGNTVLSTLYFMETFDRLPPEAIKVAAARLSYFNEEFGLPVPDMLKLAAATGMARRRDSFKQPMVGDEADWAQRTNLVSVRGGSDAGRVMQSATTMKTAGLVGMTYSPDAPTIKALQAQYGTNWKSVLGKQRGISPDAIVEKTASKKKTAIIGPMVDIANFGLPSGVGYLMGRDEGRRHAQYHKDLDEPSIALGAVVPGYIGYRYGKRHGFDEARGPLKKKRKHSSAIAVDVSKLEPEFYTQNKKVKLSALGGRYSLDSFSDVQDAVNFFTESWVLLDPAERHEFSVKTAARASELGIEVPELMERYGSTTYGPDVEAHLANRRAAAPQFAPVWNDLQEKRAMIAPETFAQLLREADELCNLNYEWGGAVMDPYYATFGGAGHEKVAWAWESADGTAIDEAGLRAIPSDKLAANFTPDFAQAFSHDPVTIFESMPDQHKTIIARMAGG